MVNEFGMADINGVQIFEKTKATINSKSLDIKHLIDHSGSGKFYLSQSPENITLKKKLKQRRTRLPKKNNKKE